MNAILVNHIYIFADNSALTFENKITRNTYLGIKMTLMKIFKWLDVNTLSLSVIISSVILVLLYQSGCSLYYCIVSVVFIILHCTAEC